MSIPLSETSAFVLVCDKVSYQSVKTRQFLSHLDCSAGRKMYDKVQHLKPHVDEIIPNRKFLIHQSIQQAFTKYRQQEVQVLVLACGWDAILVKLYEEFPRATFFGVDNESVNNQHSLVQKIVPKARIVYIQEDITHPLKLLTKLKAKGLSHSTPTYIVTEGISCYITESVFWHTVSQLVSSMQSDIFIAGDFLIDNSQIKNSPVSLRMSTDIFNMIQTECDVPYYSYTTEAIQKHLQLMGFSGIQLFSQYDIQKQRTGAYLPWTDKDKGHIYCFTGYRKGVLPS